MHSSVTDSLLDRNIDSTRFVLRFRNGSVSHDTLLERYQNVLTSSHAFRADRCTEEDSPQDHEIVALVLAHPRCRNDRCFRRPGRSDSGAQVCR